METCDAASVTEGDACPEDCTTDPGENILERVNEFDAEGLAEGQTMLVCPCCGWRCLE